MVMARIYYLLLVIIIALSFSACAKPKVALTLSKTEIKQGDSVSVNWKSENAKEVDLNGEKVAKTGTQTFQPMQTTTYELIGKRGKKEAKDKQTVTVQVIAAATTPTNKPLDHSAIVKDEKTTPNNGILAVVKDRFEHGI